MAKQDNAGKGEFRGDKKFGQSWLHGPEERLKALLIPIVPKRVETYHLTSMTVCTSPTLVQAQKPALSP